MVYCDECEKDVLLNRDIDSETNKPYSYCAECGNEIKEDFN